MSRRAHNDPNRPKAPGFPGWLSAAALLALVLTVGSRDALALPIADPGFESYAVASGDFLLAPSGPWSFLNNAGVVEPFSASQSAGGLLTWSATFAAFEGQQYASTFGGVDFIRQEVLFPSAGDYIVSVYAAAPDGTVDFDGTAQTLVQGMFAFTLNESDPFDPVATINVASFQIDPGTDWTLFSAIMSVSTPGLHMVGVENTLGGSYFINYDSFAIVIPEPSSALLLALALPALALLRRRL